MKSRFRFWSDTSEAQFLDGAAALGLQIELNGHVALVPPEAFDLALDCGATVEDDHSSSGVDALQDTEAFSVRSDAAKMPGYAPPPVTTVFYKKTERRKTWSQP